MCMLTTAQPEVLRIELEHGDHGTTFWLKYNVLDIFHFFNDPPEVVEEYYVIHSQHRAGKQYASLGILDAPQVEQIQIKRRKRLLEVIAENPWKSTFVAVLSLAGSYYAYKEMTGGIADKPRPPVLIDPEKRNLTIRNSENIDLRGLDLDGSITIIESTGINLNDYPPRQPWTP